MLLKEHFRLNTVGFLLSVCLIAAGAALGGTIGSMNSRINNAEVEVNRLKAAHAQLTEANRQLTSLNEELQAENGLLKMSLEELSADVPTFDGCASDELAESFASLSDADLGAVARLSQLGFTLCK